MKAIALLEVQAMVAAIAGLDAMVKAADVKLIHVEKRLGGRLVTVVVEGEVGGWKRYPSGHCYFTLKDESSASMLRSVCIALAKRGDVCAGRLASLLVAYHALTPIPGIAPSNVAPYKFSRLSESLEAFLATLEINP